MGQHWIGFAREAAAERHGYGTAFDLPVYLLHDVPPDVATAGEQHERLEADVVFGSACEFEAWPSVPIRVVAGDEDRFFPAEFQRLAQERLGVEVDELPGGHLMALSQSSALANFLLDV